MSASTPFFAYAAAAERTAVSVGVNLSASNGVLVALSGGADSVFLLHTLFELSARLGFRLEALHVEHGIRGEESMRDADFCKSLCGSLSVPISVVHVDVPVECKATGEGIEEAARRLRYTALESCRAERALDYIAVAHNETDQGETVLHHLLRGSGARGLSGMQVLTGRVWRPLLTVSAEAIRGTLDSLGISYMTDSTNADTAYTRNYLRECIFPALSRVTPNPASAIARAASLVSRDLALLDKMADDFYADAERRWHRPSLAALDAPILSRVLLRLFRDSGAEMPSAVHIDAAVAQIKRQGTSRVSCPSGFTLTVGRDRVSLTRSPDEPLPETALVLGMNDLMGREAKILMLNSENEKEAPHSLIVYKKSNKALISSDKIIGKLYVREARSGDAYRFGSMSRSVKKLFSARHFSDQERKIIPVVCDSKGILWIPGFGVREDADGRASAAHEITTLIYIPDNEKGHCDA